MPLIRKDPPANPPAPVGDGGGLSSSNSDGRWSAARALAGDPKGVAPLAAALASESDARVREAIFTSLARIGGDGAVSVLLPCLRSDDANLRTGALDALRAMPQSAAAALPGLLGDPDLDVRILACELARQIPAAEATRILGEVLRRETEANVCASAIEVLAEVGEPEALPALAACAARFPDEGFLSFAIKVASDRIGAAARG